MEQNQDIKNHAPFNNDNDEISLIDLFAVLLRYKLLIISSTLLAAIGVVVFSVISLVLPPESSPLPNMYTPAAHMLINDPTPSGSAGLAALINSSGLGGLASLAGVSSKGGSSYGSLAVYLTGTNSFLDSIIDKFNLISRYKIEMSVKAESRKALAANLNADIDPKTSIFTISFTDIDPVFAQSVVNYAVDYLETRFFDMGLDKNKLEKTNLDLNIKNTYKEILRLQGRAKELEFSVSQSTNPANIPSIMLETNMIKLELNAQEQVYTNLKAQNELLKIKMASEIPVFQILERPEVPDKKSKPGRAMLCFIVTLTAFFLSIFAALALNALQNIKKDSEAMAKLRRKKK